MTLCEKTLRIAVNHAGPRYAPGLDDKAPNLQIEDLLLAIDCVGRTPSARATLEDLRNDVKKEWRKGHVLDAVPDLCKAKEKRFAERLKAHVTAVLAGFSTMIRKDLLDKYLSQNKKRLLWIVSGERSFHSKDGEGLREFSDKHGSHYKRYRYMAMYHRTRREVPYMG